MAERLVNSIAVERYSADSDDFDSWVEMFEAAIELAHNPADDAKEGLFKKWLPLKLDEHGRSVLKNCDMTKTWAALKEDLKKLLVNPEDKYSWLARTRVITWDGKESLHSLATRVKRAVDKFDPDGPKEREYFVRFRLALPTEYRKAIDMVCGDDRDKCTIENAKAVALRL